MSFDLEETAHALSEAGRAGMVTVEEFTNPECADRVVYGTLAHAYSR